MSNKSQRHTGHYIILAAFTVALIIFLNYWHIWRFPLLHARSFATGREFDMIVIGAEPEGVAAAVAASRSGAKVLLLDHRDGVGGLFTYGMLNTLDMNYGLRHRLLTKGIFYEFYRQVEGTSFDVKNAQNVLDSMVKKEPNITFWHNTKFLKAVTDKKNRLVAIDILKDGIRRQIVADRYIDATQDADVAASAGVPYMYGAADRGYPGKTMAATLVFSVQGVDWDSVKRLLLHDGDPLTGADMFSAWGFSDEMGKYKPTTVRIKMRGLNMGRQRNGSVLINGLLIFDVDGTSPSSRQNAFLIAKKELPHIMNHLRENVVGFKKAKLLSTAHELYIRESRHIIGEYRLTINDILENHDQWDRIAIGSYPVDLQAIDYQGYGLITGKPVQYSIPFRSLVPLKIDNLLVVGRSASYTSVAAGSARVVPIGMCEGEAAGVAAAYSISKNYSFREMSRNREVITDIQKTLKRRGAYLQPFQVFNAHTLHWSYPGLRILLPTGAVQGWYTNDFRFTEAITEKHFALLAANILRVLKGDNHARNISGNYFKTAASTPITANKASYYLLIMNGYQESYRKDVNYLLLAKEQGLLTTKALANGFGKEEVLFSHAYELLSCTYQRLVKESTNNFAPFPKNGI